LRCEICGKEVDERGTMIEVDGAKLLACAQCRKFGGEDGQRLKKPNPVQFSPASVRPVEPRTPLSQTMAKTSRKAPQRFIEPRAPRRRIERLVPQEYELVEDYPQMIKQGREALGLSQSELANRIGERLSIIQKLETGKIRPSDMIIDKLNRTLRIVLRAPVEDSSIPHDFKKADTELTIGDVAKQVTKKKED
jgi:putative transcription factor